MPTALTDLRNRLAANRRRAVSLVFLAALHLAAFGILLWSEDEPTARAAFLLAWGVLNFFWSALLRSPPSRWQYRPTGRTSSSRTNTSPNSCARSPLLPSI